MYRPKFWCFSCKRERWPGDCSHGRVEVSTNPLAAKIDLCAHCGVFAATCRATCKARKDKALALKAAAEPFIGTGWIPRIEVLEHALNVSDLSWAAFSTDGKWLMWRHFGLCSPGLMQVRPDWVKNHASKSERQPNMPDLLSSYARDCVPAKELGLFTCTTAGGVMYTVARFVAGPRECCVQSHFVDVFRDPTLKFLLGCNSEDVKQPVLCVQNKFGVVLGLVAPIKRSSDDVLEPVKPKRGNDGQAI